MIHTNNSLKRYAGIDCHRDFYEIHIVGDDEFEDTCRFTADTNGLLALKQYAQERNVKCAVMESSGIYWIPVYAVFSHFAKIFVVNSVLLIFSTYMKTLFYFD